MALEGLNAVKPSEREVLGGAATKPFEFAISTCKTVCDAFRNDLQRWTKHSEDKKPSWREQVNLGFFQGHKIKSLSAQLHLQANSHYGGQRHDSVRRIPP